MYLRRMWCCSYIWERFLGDEHLKFNWTPELQFVCAEAHEIGVGKVFFGPTLTLIFPLFREREKGKLHILRKVCFRMFEEILKKCVYNSVFIF